MKLDGAPENFRPLRFSTAELRAKDRLDAWRDVLSRKLLRADIDRLQHQPFRAQARLRIFDGLRFGDGRFDASVSRRDRRLIADDSDDFVILVNLDRQLTVQQREREIVLDAGHACLLDCSEPGVYARPQAGSLRCIRFPRTALATHSIAENLGALPMATSPALALLFDYLQAVDRRQNYDSQALADRIVRHAYDLIALSLGAKGDEAEQATQRGHRAARFRFVKQYLAANFTNRFLDIADVAVQHHLTPRSLQRLFESESSTFTEHVLELRLTAAHRLLTDHMLARRRISDLAMDCGFSDMSHFNHAFRRRFGESPSSVRRSTGWR